MRILQICNKSPFPPSEGGPMAMFNIADGLVKAGHQVKVLAMDTGKYPVDYTQIPEFFINNQQFEAEKIDLTVRFLPAIYYFFSGRSYLVERFISDKFRKKLIEILKKEEFDIIQLETIYTSPYIDTVRTYSKACIVLRTHNIEHKIWQRIVSNTFSPLKKLYLNHLARTLEEYELSVLGNCNGIASITPKDAVFFKEKSGEVPVVDIPFGINPEAYHPVDISKESPDLFHIGSMNWIPNEEGIRWFLHNVWPDVVDKFPGLNFHLAGRSMPIWLKNNKTKNLLVYGEVPDAQEFMNDHDIMIVPLLSGSGIRIKIIEGMALGKVVISTSIGAEGIEAVNGKHLLIADTPTAFLNVIKFCIENPEKACEIGKNARKLIEEKYNNGLIIKRLCSFYESLLSV